MSGMPAMPEMNDPKLTNTIDEVADFPEDFDDEIEDEDDEEDFDEEDECDADD